MARVTFPKAKAVIMQVQRRATFLCSPLDWVIGKRESWAEIEERSDKLQHGAQMPGLASYGNIENGYRVVDHWWGGGGGGLSDPWRSRCALQITKNGLILANFKAFILMQTGGLLFLSLGLISAGRHWNKHVAKASFDTTCLGDYHLQSNCTCTEQLCRARVLKKSLKRWRAKEHGNPSDSAQQPNSETAKQRVWRQI